MKCQKNNFGLSAALFLTTLFFYLLTLPQDVFPQSSFQGKTITIIQGLDREVIDILKKLVGDGPLPSVR